MSLEEALRAAREALEEAARTDELVGRTRAEREARRQAHRERVRQAVERLLAAQRTKT